MEKWETQTLWIQKEFLDLSNLFQVAKRGGGVAKGAKDLYEKETKKSAISKSNSLDYKYIDETKQIEDKNKGDN